MAKCPSCGAVLEVSLTVGTDYSKAKEILAAKSGGNDLTNEQLNAVKWKQSEKRAALSTILVNESSLGVPIIRQLYDWLTTAANKSWKVEGITYKLSQNQEGTAEWLQRWRPLAAGSS